MKKYIIYLLLVTAIFFIACKKDHDFDKLAGTNWNPKLAVPLINSSLAVEDILQSADEQDFLEIGGDKMITLVYNSQLYSIKGDEFIDIQSVISTLTDTFNIIEFPFPGGAKIRNVEIISGKMNYSITSQDTQKVDLSLKMPYVTKSGTPFEENILLENTGGSSNYKSGNFDLSGYNFDFSSNGNYTNSLIIEYLARLTSNLTNVTSNYPLNINFQDLVFQYVDGYLGLFNFNIQADTMSLSIFKNWVGGTVFLDDPKINLSITNSFGIPITADFSTFEAWSDVEGGNVIPIVSNTDISDTFLINYPDLTEIGNSIDSDYTLDNNNSNINNVISISPKQLRYALFFLANADVDTTQINFITKDSEFSVDLDLKLPMHGRIDDMKIRDTFDLDVSTESLFNQLKSAKFKLQTENKLPLSVDLQVYFTDDEHQLLDSLLVGEETILKAGEVDAQGKVVTAENKTTFVSFDKKNSENIDSASKLIIKAKLNTTDGGDTSIKLYTDYYLKIKLGVIANTQLN
ncbi:MAG: hypothetical protein WED10_07320 [Brumimicrobium sp.]